MSRDIFNNAEEAPTTDAVVETPAVETPAVETEVAPVEVAPVVEPEMNRAIHGSIMESTIETVEEPKAEEPVVEAPKVEEPVVSKNDSSGDVAIYTLRSLTFPGGVTIPKGYSFVSKSKYEKIANHKAVRIASKDEVKTYLK